MTFFAKDGKVTHDEWDYAMKAYEEQSCTICLPLLPRVSDHGSDTIRMNRILAAYEAFARSNPKAARDASKLLLPSSDGKDPEFLLRIEPKVPAVIHAWYDAHTLHLPYIAARKQKLAPDVQERITRRYVQALAQEPTTEEPRD